MRFVTTALTIAVIVSIIGAAAAVYVISDEARHTRDNIDEQYEIDKYREALEDAGLYPGDTPRILPGSLGSQVPSTVPVLYEGATGSEDCGDRSTPLR